MGEMTRTELEMAAGRQRLQQLQGQHEAEQVLGAKMLIGQSSVAPVEQFEVVDLPAIPTRKKKKTDVDELLASLQPRGEDEE